MTAEQMTGPLLLLTKNVATKATNTENVVRIMKDILEGGYRERL